MAHQFVVQLTHKPGALAALCRELERQGVDLKGIGGGGIGEVGHVILKTADDAKTRAVLEAGSYTFIESESVLAEVDDQRRLLFEMDRHLMHLRGTVGETDTGVIGLTGTYHNLLRLWADT